MSEYRPILNLKGSCMGDKGKKDKNKSQKQKENKKNQAAKKKQERNPKRG